MVNTLVSQALRSSWLHRIVSWTLSRVPPATHHTVAKALAIRKAFAYTGLEGVPGDYIEFGVYRGASMISAIHAHRYQARYYNNQPCRFIGCDSFEGLRPVAGSDSNHPHFRDGAFTLTSCEAVWRTLQPYRGRAEIHLVAGDFAETVGRGALAPLGVTALRVVLIDCDLQSSTLVALRASAPYWQPGTVLIFDDFFSYRGDEDCGEAGGLAQFCAQTPGYQFRQFGTYSFNGALLIVTRVPGPQMRDRHYNQPSHSGMSETQPRA